VSTWALTATGFAAVGVALVLLNYSGKRPGARVPSFGALCGFLMRDPWGRAGVLLAWWWLGWHFLARS
jgi:hypothetical protein